MVSPESAHRTPIVASLATPGTKAHGARECPFSKHDKNQRNAREIDLAQLSRGVRTYHCLSVKFRPNALEPEVGENTMPVPLCPPELHTGLPEMDALHALLSQALIQASQSPDDELAGRFLPLVRNAERAFSIEEAWMERISFADAKMHREHHALVLSGLHRTHSRIMAGDYSAGRDLVDRLLPQWLHFHSDTMDLSLALAVERDRRPDASPPRTGSRAALNTQPVERPVYLV
jgi:hemerythrin